MVKTVYYAAPQVSQPADDRFRDGTYTDAVGSLNYRLYLSSALCPHPPLFVMLHGATQSAADFAIGTRMHQMADECGGIALFPEQSRSAHPMGCWNWYDSRHQVARQGEPSMLAGLTRQIIGEHAVDERRVYVAGLSAGGAMAVILGQAYPELYAAVGVHSGIATGVANDLMSALRVMSSGPPDQPSAAQRPSSLVCGVPTIIFHGDRDQTVHPTNATALLAQALMKSPSESSDAASIAYSVRVPGGREVTLVRHARREGQPDAEMWMVHGGGHAWAGGNSKGSYTDESGPDASREMLRFFLNQSLTPVPERKVG